MGIIQNRYNIDYYVNGILAQDRFILSRAITLIESKRPEDNHLSEKIIMALMPHTGRSVRIGITGIPGVGKSTFIEYLGTLLISLGKRVAVLAIDPSSQKTKGSILGDKTRMEALSKNVNAFIRPSPTGETLGGVAEKTKESLLLCEAAGYDAILIETVGVGQSETLVHNMVDIFMLLVIAGAGDELQGIKKGIVELADIIVINKDDGNNTSEITKTKANLINALHYTQPHAKNWMVPVISCSSISGNGVDKVSTKLDEFMSQMQENGYFTQNRINQDMKWFDNELKSSLLQLLKENQFIAKRISDLRRAISERQIHPKMAVKEIVAGISIKE